ncbi:MAG: AAA family ATPase [Thaumarchaeota archaeon]|nr:AAA family ATPase [Nitrososphaerota archaeon]
MPLESLMWVEKYRPHKLEDVINQTEVKERLAPLLEKPQEMPHLLFAGPPGSGKTTLAHIVAEQLLGDLKSDYTLSLNASDERGIDTVRERVKVFASYSDRREGVPFRLVILDEADEMCLDPETRVLVGKLDDLKEATLQELLETHGDGCFDLPSFSSRGMRLEDDTGHIVQSGTANLYRVTFEDGRSVLASAEHPFFVIEGRSVKVLRTRELRPGSELADFSNKVMRCYSCSRPFYRPHEYGKYQHHFCSNRCRNSFFGAISAQRTPEERHRIGLSGADSLARRGTYQSKEYRNKRSQIALKLIDEGRIPNPKTWAKYKKGEGAWLGKRLTKEHKEAIGRGGARYFAQHPEMKAPMAAKVKKSLANPDGRYRKLVKDGFFKQASKRAYLASVQYWKDHGFRSKTEQKMAQLLESWKIPYQRERLIVTNQKGNKYPFAIDFVIGNKIALLVNGCWWHVCPTCGVQAKYEKQKRNLEKDYRHVKELESLGYRVVVVWEHELGDEKIISDSVLPRIFHTVGISGGPAQKILHARVRSVVQERKARVLNIAVGNNQNFLLGNGILTHNTRDAQTALRRIMEESSRFTRFILICNYSSSIIEPIQSRCAIFRFQRVAAEQVSGSLKKIAKSEGVKVTEKVLEAMYETTGGDLRQAINLLQAASAGGEVTLERVEKVTGATVKERAAEIIRLALDGDFSAARIKLVELTRVYGIPETDFLRFANEAVVSSGGERMADAIKIVAEYDYRLILGASPEIQLTAMLAELAALKGK